MEMTTAMQNVSIGKCLACFRDSDAVVGEVAVHLRNKDHYHMTGGASAGRDRTGLAFMAASFVRRQ
jgi:hypothetical protein